MRKIIIAVCCLTIGVWAARGDVLPDRYKKVRHLVRLENLVDYTNYIFYIRSTAITPFRNNAPLRVTENGAGVGGLDPRLWTQGELRLYAVPKARFASPNGFPNGAWFTNSSPGILQCKLPVVPTKTLPEDDPANVIEDIFRVNISGDKLELTPVRTDRRASITTVQMALLLLAAPAMFILLRRGRARFSVVADRKF